MKRHLSRSLAALAAISLLFPCAAASAHDGETVGVFVLDRTGTPPNVRDSPQGEIVGSLKVRRDYTVGLIGCEPGGWCQIDGVASAGGGERVELDSASGELWMHSSILAFSTRNYGGQRLSLRAAPSKTAKPVFSFKDERELRPRGLSDDGAWIRASTLDGKHKGWLETRWVCGNPLTTCP